MSDTRRIALDHAVKIVGHASSDAHEIIKQAQIFEAYLDYRDKQASQTQPPPSAVMLTVTKKADW